MSYVLYTTSITYVRFWLRYLPKYPKIGHPLWTFPKINDTLKDSNIKVCITSEPDKFLRFILTVFSRHTCTGQQQQNKAGQSAPLQVVAGESVNTTLLTCPQTFFVASAGKTTSTASSDSLDSASCSSLNLNKSRC